MNVISDAIVLLIVALILIPILVLVVVYTTNWAGNVITLLGGIGPVLPVP